MKFAEMTQEVVVARGQEVQFDENVLQPGRRKQNLLYKRLSGVEALSEITNTRNSFGFNLPAIPPAFRLPPLPTWSVSQIHPSEPHFRTFCNAFFAGQSLTHKMSSLVALLCIFIV